MVKYPFSSKLMFAIVMHDTEACRQFIEKLFPEKKVKEIRFKEREEAKESRTSRSKSRKLAEVDDTNLFNNGNKTESKNQYGSKESQTDKSQSWKDSVAEVEKTIIMGLESKSVRLDVLFEGDDTLYDIELQIQREEDIPRRSRYYHMAMGRNALRMGDPYSKLKASYVIFICCYDAFDKDEPIYRFEMIDENLQLKLGDGSSTIILNTKCSEEKIPEDLKAFYDFVNTGKVDSSDKLVSYLDKRVEEANENEEVDRIMTLEEELIIQYDNGLRTGVAQGLAQGLAQGAAQKQREIAKNLKRAGIGINVIAENTGLTVEEIENL